ncbi:MAG: Nif3-like dinuclear metal center hexameric protein, partial [Bacteroidia bacterium]
IKAIQHNIAIYAAHTNVDNVKDGVNAKIAEKLGLSALRILSPKKNLLKKLVTFAPGKDADKVRDGLFAAGAGAIGQYDDCSFSGEGKGTFRGNANSNPVIGEKGIRTTAAEERIEVIFEAYREPQIMRSLFATHPYEEVAYDIYSLDNFYQNVGSGMSGEFPEAMREADFLTLVKKTFGLKFLKHTPLLERPVKKVAFCGGSGSFLIKAAISAGADAYISSDIKYHEFFDADGKILIADTGHFENEQFTPELFQGVITGKYPEARLHFSKINTNPVLYF